MKKIGLLFMFVLILNIFSVILVHAQDEPPMPGDAGRIQNFSETTTKTLEDLKEQEKREYMLNEWRNMFLGNPFGKVLVNIWDFSKPFLTFIIGTPAEISWKFAIAVIIFIGFLFFFGETFMMASPFSKSTSWIISVGLVIILSLTKFIDSIATFLDSLLSKWWGKLIIILVIIILVSAYSVLGKSYKEKKDKDKLEEDRKKLHRDVKIAEAFTKGMTK